MKIVIHLTDEEAYREVEDDDENMRAAYREIIRQIENVCTVHQIRFTEIETIFGERK